MTLRVTIELAGAAVPKGRARATARPTKSGNYVATVYPDGKTVKYEAQLRYAGQCAMADQAPGEGPTIQPCRVTVDVYLQAPKNPEGGKRIRAAMLAGAMRPTKKPDADNFLKTVGDALNGVVWSDDSVVADAAVRKWWAEHPRLVVTVETIEPPVLPAVAAAAQPAPPAPADLFGPAG